MRILCLNSMSSLLDSFSDCWESITKISYPSLDDAVDCNDYKSWFLISSMWQFGMLLTFEEYFETKVFQNESWIFQISFCIDCYLLSPKVFFFRAKELIRLSFITPVRLKFPVRFSSWAKKLNFDIFLGIW